MILGVGIDTVSISDVERILEKGLNADEFFSKAEITAAKGEGDLPDYFSRCYAVKEATFKALDHLMGDRDFDLNSVETLHHEDGAPYIHCSKELTKVLREIGVYDLKVSITTEAGLATAIVIAQGKPNV